MKKLIIFLLFVFLLSSCSIQNNDINSINDIYKKVDFNKIDKIKVIYGNTGERKEIIDTDIIKDIIKEIQKLKGEKINREDKDGYTYYLTFYAGTEEIITMVPSKDMEINGDAFSLENSDKEEIIKDISLILNDQE